MRLRQLGLTLVEVMVAVVIGLIGILIITQAYITSDNFNRATLGEGGAQMNGLVALYSIERDMRMAGWGINNAPARGCGNMYWHYNGAYSANNGGALPDVRIAPVVITVTPANPDQVTILYGTDAQRMMPTTINAFSAGIPDISVDGADGFHPVPPATAPNDYILLVSASGCTLRRVSAAQPVSQKLEMAPGADMPQNPAGWGAFPTTYAQDDVVLNLGNPVLRTYLISNGNLASADSLLQNGAVTNQDLVDSIVDLRALYGKDTDANNIVETYNNATPTTAAGWQQVLSVKIGILARIGIFEKPSVSGGNCDATTVAPTWSGGGFPAVDIATVTSQARCYRYRVFETTIPLRNMIWAAS